MLRDISYIDPEWEIVILRYFNPVGAHKTGIIGETPNGTPNNLFPYILDVIRGHRSHLNVYGSDYDTHDGTGVRDYIHVVDLALGHIKAIKHLNRGTQTYNLGTGTGYSVLDIVNMFNKILSISGDERRVEYKLTDRRDGDTPAVYADCSLANKNLNWEATRDLEQMVTDSLTFMNLS